jgi:hypothetical protein
MRLIHASLLVGAAVLGLGELALPAAAKDPAVHEMTIQLPGGGTETIRYTGDVAPMVTFVQAPFAVALPAPVDFGFAPSFAALDRIAADMDRQMDAFWRQAQTIARWSPDSSLTEASLPQLTPGSSAYSFVSESFGNDVCVRMTEITSSPNGGKPKVVSRTSGKCDASPTGALAAPNPSSVRTIAVHNTVPATAVPRTAL